MKKLLLALVGLLPMLVGAQPFGGGGPFPKPSSSGNVIYTSMLNGIHTNANLVTGGGTDDHLVIQAALDKSTNGFPLTIVHDGCSMLTVGLIIHSNTTFYTLPNCGFWLSNYCDTAMLANDLNTNYSSRNITVIGGKWNQNGTNQHFYTKHVNGASPSISTGFYVVGMWFAGVTNLVIKDVEIIQPTIYGVLLNDSRDFYIDNLFVNYAIAEALTGGGGDGLHLFGDVRDGRVSYRANGADDRLTFDANSNQSYWLTNAFANPAKNCIQSNIVVNGFTTFKGGPFWTRSQSINFQNDDALGRFGAVISDITIKNVKLTDSTTVFRGAIYGGRNFIFENFDAQLVTGSGWSANQLTMFGATNVIVRDFVYDASKSTNSGTLFSLISCSNIVVSGIKADFGTNTGSYLINVSNSTATLGDVVQRGGNVLYPFPPVDLAVSDVRLLPVQENNTLWVGIFNPGGMPNIHGIDPANNILGANSLTLGALTASNGVFWGTVWVPVNSSLVTATGGDNTNEVYATGFENLLANGKYVLKTSGNLYTYTNTYTAGGLTTLRHVLDLVNQTFIPVISNVFSGEIEGAQTDSQVAQWFKLPSGDPSAGITLFGTNMQYQLLNNAAVQTNWISGQIYTNTSSTDWHVRALATWTTAAVNGDAEMDLFVGAQGAAMVRLSGAGAATANLVTLPQSYTNEISGYIGAGRIFAFTNNSAGSGNLSTLVPGTGQKKQW